MRGRRSRATWHLQYVYTYIYIYVCLLNEVCSFIYYLVLIYIFWAIVHGPPQRQSTNPSRMIQLGVEVAKRMGQ